MKIRTDASLLGLNFLCLWGITLTQALGKPGLASLMFTCTFPLTLALWLVRTEQAMEEENCLTVAIFWLSAVSVCLNALMSGTVVTFSYLKKLILFWCTVAMLGAVSRYRPGKREVGFLLAGNTVISCLLCLFYLLRRQEMFLLNGMVTGYLTFRFTNPNLAALFLAAMAMIQFARPEMGRKWVFHRMLGVILTFFVYKTQSRNAMLILLCFLLLSLLSRRKQVIGKKAAALLSLLPLVFAAAYLLFVSAPWVQQRFSFLAGEGKGLDSRVEVWRFAVDAFLTRPITGAYSQISFGTGASQMHNTHLDLLASYGIGVFLLVWRLLYLLLYREGEGRTAAKFRLALLCLFLSGMGEASLFSGGMGISLYAGMLGLLANFDYGETL